MDQKKVLLEQALEIANTNYGMQVQATSLPGEIDDNFKLRTEKGQVYVLKFAHPDTKEDHLAFQIELLEHLKQSANTIVAIPETVSTLDGQKMIHFKGRKVRLLSWISGIPWAKVHPKTPHLREQLGRECAQLTWALQAFDHPGAHRFIKWDTAQVDWIRPHLRLFEGEQRQLVQYFLDQFEKTILPVEESLRKSVIQNDFNDYNIIVEAQNEHPGILGLIDFGDAVFSYTISELAIACVYAIMDLPDPLSALAEIVAAYHRVFPLNEEEILALLPLIGARLLISVTASALNKEAHPENEYLQISEKPAWILLQQLYGLSPNWIHYTLRKVCGFHPIPEMDAYLGWFKQQQGRFSPVVPVDFQQERYTQLDLSVDSKELGNFHHYLTEPLFTKRISQLLMQERTKAAVGGYGEIRPFYTTDNYLVSGNEGPKWRTVHLGIDIWMPSGTPVFCPYEGEVHSVFDNAGDRNYGPTIILKHQTDTNLPFYTLYGHLGMECLEELEVGQFVKAWQPIATIGRAPENGNWPPHLHFQIMLDLLGNQHDFPGVAFPDEQEVWLSICPDPNLILNIPWDSKPTKLSAAEILTKRRKVIGPNLSISYREHLHMVRGIGQYLMDSNGQRYLDMVNNVAHVGHEHPQVVAAGQKQMGVLNTNSRYVHENLVLYAEELLATLPPAFEVCYFVNSGSEANELALRMAHTLRGSRHMIAVEVGYHGNTTGTIDVSSYKFDGKGGAGAPSYTHKIPLPDTFRGIYRDPNTAGKQYAQYVERLIDQLERNGQKLAGFIGESILSCGGQIVLPPDFFKEVFHRVRAAGGLCIVDEVQVGFGRVGDHFWGFELQGVLPDIVTMGKPIGNGHPLGAVVTTRAIADAFANGMEFFSTFGGNPVSCAIGRAVLQVVQSEDLQENARLTGNYLMQEVRGLQRDFPLIADVRGSGLFIGIELIEDLEEMQPATQKAKYLVNRMRHKGILLSTDGPDNNVIKIKPPLCFTENNVDFFLQNFESVLKEGYLKP